MLRPRKQYDLLFAADVTRKGDAGFRISREIRACAEIGLKTGVMHLGNGSSTSPASPDLEKCRREGLFDVVPAAHKASVRLVVVHSPEGLKEPATQLSNITAKKVVLVHDRRADLCQMGLWFSLQIGPTVWAPTNRWTRSALMDLRMPVEILEEDWRPIAYPVSTMTVRPGQDSEFLVGRVSFPDNSQWQNTVQEFKTSHLLGGNCQFMTLGVPPTSFGKEFKNSDTLSVLRYGDITVERFVQMLDAFIYFPRGAFPIVPEAAIVSAIASSKLVVLPPHLRPHFGPGAIYCDPEDVAATVKELRSDAIGMQAHFDRAKSDVLRRFSKEAYQNRVLSLLGGKSRPKKVQKPARKAVRKSRVLFVPSNGVGLGHAARLLAVARRMDKRAEPVFLTMAQAAPIIETFGYIAEYVPSHGDVGVKLSRWDQWFRHELEAAIERHDPSVIVYDGNNPTPGLVTATQGMGKKLVWVRRGMLGAKPSRYMDNARFMDLIIEPGEIAGDWDNGPTASRRHEVLLTNPITLLDTQEIPTREVARKALGLETDRLAVLVHVGGGLTRNSAPLIADIVQKLTTEEGPQIVVAHSKNTPFELPRLSNVQHLRCFPLSQFFNAFDYSVSAAGYNSYHEVLNCGLPTIFIANHDPSMDRQDTRAAFAQHHSAGFDLQEGDLFQLPAIRDALADADVRAHVRNAALSLSKMNGAQVAADAIMDVIEAG